jgi:hypothetical protein
MRALRLRGGSDAGLLLLLRGGAVGAGLLLLLLVLARPLVTATLPLMQAAFEHLVDDFRVLSFGFDREGADLVLRVVVKVAHYAVIGDQVMTPEGPGLANASTMAAQGLQSSFVALWILLAWPAPDVLVTRSRRLALAMVPLLVLFALDAPVVLAASLWRIVLDALSPGAFSPLLLARDLLQGGGRLALGAAIGAAAVALATHRPQLQTAAT